MAEIVIGRALDRLRIKLIRASQQAFALAWNDAAGNPADISAYTFAIILDTDPQITWSAAINTNNTTWTLNSTQSNLAEGFYAGKLVATDVNGPMVAYEVAVEVQ